MNSVGRPVIMSKPAQGWRIRIWPWLVLALATLPAIWYVVDFESDIDPEFPGVVRPTFNTYPPPAYRFAEPGDTIDHIAVYAAAAAIVLLGNGNAEYILAFLAVLATVGVFSLFALAAGILRLSPTESANPLIKAVVDGAFDGIVVTDKDGRVVYANAAYLDLTEASDANDLRPVGRQIQAVRKLAIGRGAVGVAIG